MQQINKQKKQKKEKKETNDKHWMPNPLPPKI